MQQESLRVITNWRNGSDFYSEYDTCSVSNIRRTIFVEKGKVTVQKEIGPNRTQFTFTGNGTMNGNIEVTNTGQLVSVSKGNLSFQQGQGVISTKDGSEAANYTLIDVFNGTELMGAQAYSTNSTGGLSFLNNIVGIYKGGQDDSGNYALEHWLWK